MSCRPSSCGAWATPRTASCRASTPPESTSRAIYVEGGMHLPDQDLADVWHLDLKIVEAEFTKVGINPVLDQFRDLNLQVIFSPHDRCRRVADRRVAGRRACRVVAHAGPAGLVAVGGPADHPAALGHRHPAAARRRYKHDRIHDHGHAGRGATTDDADE